MTTAGFTRTATDYVAKSPKRIVLIDAEGVDRDRFAEKLAAKARARLPEQLRGPPALKGNSMSMSIARRINPGRTGGRGSIHARAASTMPKNASTRPVENRIERHVGKFRRQARAVVIRAEFIPPLQPNRGDSATSIMSACHLRRK